MSDISVRTGSELLNEDQTWIGPGGISALRDNRSITLDRSAFDLAATFTDGYIPSGVFLGKITASGLYAPYAPAALDGTETSVGALAVSVAADANSTGDISAALYWHGEVVEANLPANHGLDAAGKTDLAAKFAFI